MFLYDKTNILEGLGIFEVDFAQGHEPASTIVQARISKYTDAMSKLENDTNYQFQILTITFSLLLYNCRPKLYCI